MVNWRKYAKKFFKLKMENFFVSIEELGLTKKELDILQRDFDYYKERQTPLSKNVKRTLGAQLAYNIADQILEIFDETTILSADAEHSPEELDRLLVNAFERLSIPERHFLIMVIYGEYATNELTRLWFGRVAFKGYSIVLLPKK